MEKNDTYTVPTTARFPVFKGDGIISFDEKEVLKPGKGELLLKTKANALCGSDRSQFFDGSETTPGHEAAGIVVSAGPETVTPVGTPGVVFLMDYCGECRSCTAGYTNQCLQKKGDMGFNKHGGYSPYMLVNETIFFPVDKDLSLTEATMLLDIMGTGGHAIKRAQLIHKDIESVLVTGAGPIGLGVLAMVKILLGEHIPVFITDMVPYRLDLAEKLGGIPVNVKDEVLADAFKKQGLDGVDVTLDTTGKTIARQQGLNALNQRGVLVCIGHGEGISMEISPDIIAPERTVVGSEYFHYSELEENLQLIRNHLPYLRQIITHIYGVDELQKAYEIFFEGNTGKVIVEQ
jgi:propanol-preferring alcohol dehydrogenase